MFLEFIYPLVKFFTPFNVFQYLSFRGAYAALTTLFLCCIFAPRVIQALRNLKIGQAVREDGPVTHLSKEGTPTMGGVFLVLSILITMLFWTDFSNWKVWLTLGALLCFSLVGFFDDFLKVKKHSSDGLPAWAKLVFQFLIALAVMLILYNSEDEEVTYL
jgi:phospho-N-acetylmuramoyl-pentapeptide-transferase